MPPPWRSSTNKDLPPPKHGLRLDASSTILLRALSSVLVFIEIVTLFLILFLGYHRNLTQLVQEQIKHFTFTTSLFDALCVSVVRVIVVWLQACDDELRHCGKWNGIFGFMVLIYVVVKTAMWDNWNLALNQTFLIVLLVSSILQCIQTWRIHRRVRQNQKQKAAAAAVQAGARSEARSELTQPLVESKHGHSSEMENNNDKEDKKGSSSNNTSSSSSSSLSTPASLGRLLALAGPEKWLLILGTIALFFSSGATMVVPALFGALIQTISTNATSTPEDIARSQQELNHVTMMLIIFFALTSIFTFLRGSLFTLAGERLVARFRKRLFAALTRADITFFDKTQSGELVTRLASDSAVIQNAVTVNISMALRFVAQFVVGVLLLFVLSPSLTGIMLASVPAVVIGAVTYGRLVRKIGTAYQKSLAEAGEIASEVLGNVRTVRSFAKEKSELYRYSVSIDRSYHHGRYVFYTSMSCCFVVLIFFTADFWFSFSFFF